MNVSCSVELHREWQRTVPKRKLVLVGCAKRAEIISLWRFLVRRCRPCASSVKWLGSGVLPFALTRNYRKENLRFVFDCV